MRKSRSEWRFKRLGESSRKFGRIIELNEWRFKQELGDVGRIIEVNELQDR